MDPYFGEIRIFAGLFAPADWAFCEGQQLYINQYNGLYTIIGNTYGGDYQDGTFNLPDFRGLIPMHWGQGPGLTPRLPAQTGGVTANTLDYEQMPAHFHFVNASSKAGTTPVPTGNVFSNRGNPDRDYVSGGVSGALNTEMNSINLGAAGTATPAPIPNLQPFMWLNFIICLYGIYPPKP